MFLKTIVAGTFAALLSAAALAHAAPAASTPGIAKREVRQEHRIHQGVASGQLTARETYRLQREQLNIDRARAHAKSDGRVTLAERERLHHMQHHASRDIARQKHDHQVAWRR